MTRDTRDEAIEKAFEHLRKVIGENEIFRIMIAGEKSEIVAYEKHFPFDPPRRIPPKGTPVRSNISNFIGYSQGTTDAFGRLECYVYADCAEENVTGYKLIEWIELQEVKP
jgi:hypothetical protein